MVSAHNTPPEGDKQGTSEKELVPWEQDELSVPAAFYRTTIEALKTPHKFFEHVANSEDRWRAIGFALLMHIFGFSLAAFWKVAVWPDETTIIALIRVALGPLWVLVSVWLGSEMMHGLLKLVKGAKSSRSVTHRAVAYCYVTAPAMIIPKIGIPIALVLAAVYQVFALRSAHRTSGSKAAFAVIGTWLLVIGAIALAISSGDTTAIESRME